MNSIEQLPRSFNELVEKLTYVPVIVKSIEKVHDTNWSMAANRHDYFEMVYIKKGSALLQVEGIDVNIAPHSFVIIKPGRLHTFTIKSDACELIVLSFTFKTQKNETDSHISLNDFIAYMEDEATGDYLHLTLAKKNDIFHILSRILRERIKFQVWGDFLSCLFLWILRNICVQRHIKTAHKDCFRWIIYCSDTYIIKRDFHIMPLDLCIDIKTLNLFFCYMFCNSFTHRHTAFLNSKCAMGNKIRSNNFTYNKQIGIIITQQSSYWKFIF